MHLCLTAIFSLKFESMHDKNKQTNKHTALEFPSLCQSIRSESIVNATGSGLKEPMFTIDQSVPFHTQLMMSYPVGGFPFASKDTGLFPREN